MENTGGETRPGRSAGEGVSSGLDRVREVARKDKDARFTALLHHVSCLRLSLAFDALKKDAAPGVDGVTWREYDRDRQENLLALHARVQSGKYRAVPSRRVYIPKADGRLRPLGIASLEDKVLQRAVAEDFLRNWYVRHVALDSGRSSTWTSGHVLARMIAELLGPPTAQLWPASVVLEGEYDVAGVALTVPVTLGHGGVERIHEWELADEQAAGLHAGADVVRASLAAVDLG